MSKKISLVFGVLFLGLFLMTSGCGGSFETIQASPSGILLEQVFPKDIEVFMSFSTLDEDQRDFFHSIMTRFSADSSSFQNKIIEGLDSNLQSVDLSYIEDLQPILGENGFRFGLGLKAGGGTDMLMDAALTLDDAERARLLLGDLEAAGRFVRTTRDGFDIYSRVLQSPSLDEEKEANSLITRDIPETTFYFTVNEDLLLISSSEDELMNMVNLMRSENVESLWTDVTYQRFISDLPARHLVVSYVNKNLFTQGVGQISSFMLTGDSAMQDYIIAQGMVFTAQENALRIYAISFGDEEKLKTDDVTLVDLAADKSRKHYLDQTMLGGSLFGYFESYDLASSFKKLIGLMTLSSSGEDVTEETIPEIPVFAQAEQLLGISMEDLLGMMGEGYSIAVHRNKGFLPGITVLIDASDGEVSANTLVKSLNDYLSVILGVLQLQKGELAGAISSHDQTIFGGEFHVVQADVDMLMALYNAGGGAFILPEEIQGLKLTFLFGLTEEGRLLISTYEGWLTEDQTVLAKDSIYEKTTEDFPKSSKGITYINFDEVLSYAKEFKIFRDSLRSNAESLMQQYPELLTTGTEETITETSTEPVQLIPEGETEAIDIDLSVEPVVVEEEVVVEPATGMSSEEWVDFLDPLKSFACSGITNDTTIEFNGVLLFDEPLQE
ncbi:MAG: hypothetical protein WC882_04270 [Candidatus Gracilibacteria bacterium]